MSHWGHIKGVNYDQKPNTVIYTADKIHSKHINI